MRELDSKEPFPENQSDVRNNGNGGARTRREVLKRGAVVGAGTIVWVTPVVQQLTMSEAAAQAVSPGGEPPSVGGDTVTSTTSPATSTTSTTSPASPVTPTNPPAPSNTAPPQRPISEQVGTGGSGTSSESAGASRTRDADASRTLPVTGGDLVGLGAAGLGAVATGKVLRRAADRRRATPEQPPQGDDDA